MNVETRIKRIADKNNLSYKTVMDQVLKGALIEHNEHPWGTVSQAIKISLDHIESNVNHYKKELMKYSLNGIGALTTADFYQDKNLGKYVYPKSGNVNVRATPTTSASIITTVAPGKKIGYILATSDKQADGYFWFFVKFDSPINGKETGFVATTVVSMDGSQVTPPSSGTANTVAAEKLLTAVVETDVVIYKRLLVMKAQIEMLRSRGIPVTDLEKIHNTLVARYTARQTRLKNVVTANGMFVNQPAYQLYQWIRTKWGLGAIQIPAAIVIGVVVIGTATIAYAIIKALEPEYSDQEVDLKITGQFKEWYDKIPDEQAKKAIAQELEQQIDDAYNQGVKDGSGDSLFDTLKLIGIAVLSVWGFDKLMDYGDKRKKRSANGPA